MNVYQLATELYPLDGTAPDVVFALREAFTEGYFTAREREL